ncbi:MAG: AAA-like domain-containing protein [Cyanobacteria bacterium P01_F01_bin.53]
MGAARLSMDSDSELTWTVAKQLADQLLFESTDKHLSDIESQVLQGSWEGKSYGAIAEELGYTLEYINSDVGYGLWTKLSKATGEKLTKRSFRGALARYRARQSQKTETPQSTTASSSSRLASTSASPVPQQDIDCYIDRPPAEQRCFDAIVQPGALIRIKAPPKMGKTWLVDRVLHYAEQQGYAIVPINLLRVESTVIQDLDRFLKYFCTRVTRQLKLENNLSDYWDEELGSNTSCTEYFETYILQESDRPIVLALDNVDRLFSYEAVATNFFSLLRAWYEDARILPDWQQLRPIIAHSTDIYPTLNINRSPFNVGLPIELAEFSQTQLTQLVERQNLLQASPSKIQALSDLVGGHPYLFQQALEQLRTHPEMSVEDLITTAPTDAGPYTQHLRNLLAHLQDNPDMADAMKTILKSDASTRVKSEVGFRLNSLGLVRFQGNRVEIRCPLYRLYLCDRLEEF